MGFVGEPPARTRCPMGRAATVHPRRALRHGVLGGAAVGTRARGPGRLRDARSVGSAVPRSDRAKRLPRARRAGGSGRPSDPFLARAPGPRLGATSGPGRGHPGRGPGRSARAFTGPRGPPGGRGARRVTGAARFERSSRRRRAVGVGQGPGARHDRHWTRRRHRPRGLVRLRGTAPLAPEAGAATLLRRPHVHVHRSSSGAAL